MSNKPVYFYYRPGMVLPFCEKNISRSPEKPARFLKYLKDDAGLAAQMKVVDDWQPFEQSDFEVAHAAEYVHAVFTGEKPLCESNGLQWSPQFVNTLCYTNAGLYAALYGCLDVPEKIHLAPVSGFHHASPNRGGGFCTFSGQVIASVKIYLERGMSGAYIDLDGHFGNSIEDSRRFVSYLDEAVPVGMNINPQGTHRQYLNSLALELSRLKNSLLAGEIHYVVMCHGADSHEDDDLGGQLTTDEWLEASHMVYDTVASVACMTGKPVPLALTLFGGYREDNYDFVLWLHKEDLRIALEYKGVHYVK